MTSILDRITEEHIHSDPFPYLTTTEALEPSYYESLAAHYPDFPNSIRMRGNDETRQRLSKRNRSRLGWTSGPRDWPKQVTQRRRWSPTKRRHDYGHTFR